MTHGRDAWGRTIAAAAVLAVLVVPVLAAEETAPVAEKKVERKIVIRDGEGPEQVFVWTGDADPNVVSGAYLGVGLREETESPDGGARVTAVVPGSPADKAGVEEGDVVVAFNGKVIRGPAALTERIHAAKPGDKATIDVVRDGKRKSLDVELTARTGGFRFFGGRGEAPLDEEHMKALEENLKGLDERLKGLDLDIEPNVRSFRFHGPGARAFLFSGKPLLGVELVETTPELRTHLGGTKEAGVLVGRVLGDSAAEKAGVRVGDLIVSVDGDSIGDASDLIDAVSSRAGKTVDLGIIRDGRATSVKATLPADEPEVDLPTGPRARHVPPPARSGTV